MNSLGWIAGAIIWGTGVIVRFAVALCPADFRAEYGDDLVRTHRELMDSARRQGGVALMRTALRDASGALWVATRLRLGRDVSSVSTSTFYRRTPMFDTLWQDSRFAFRGIARNPGFAATVITVLALGIGGVSAIFSVVNAYLFRPLPFADEHSLVTIYETNPEFGWDDASAAPANALDWRDQVDAFDDLAIYSEFANEATLIIDGEPTLLAGGGVTGNFFEVAGVRAALGRALRWDETWAPNATSIVLSDRTWRTTFGADPSILGRGLDFSGRIMTVVGVMPPTFNFPSNETDYWAPMGWEPTARQEVWFRRAHFVRTLARLAPGATQQEASAQLAVVVRRLQAEYPGTNKVMGAGLMPVRDFLIRDVRKPLLILGAAVSLLLILACTNVATLTLVRASERAREVAVRTAVGANRMRIARQMMTEALLLACLGGTAGLGLGWFAVKAIERLNPLGIPGVTSIALDGRVLFATLAVATLSGILFGLGPALNGANTAPARSLKEGGRADTRSRGGMQSTQWLVGGEVALALLLVAGAGLVLRSFGHIRDVDPGFHVENTLAFDVTAPTSRYSEREDVLAFWDQLTEQLEARPGIERVGTVGRLPLDGTSWSSQFKAEGWPEDRVGIEILHRRSDRGYFEALGIPLVRGRLFESADRDGPLVVVINEQFAAEHFPGEEPLGQRIAYDREPDDESSWYEIVGVVGDQHQISPAQSVRAEVFENRDQDWSRQTNVVVRTAGDPSAAIPIIRSVVAELDPLIPIAEPRPLRRVWRSSIAQEELILMLLGGFGLIALLIAAVGVYGVTARAARRRTHEIGIRMALGAQRRDILTMMLTQGFGVVVLGLVVGLGLALASTRALSSLLFGVTPNDPLTLGSVVVLLAAVAMVASYLPAFRSTRVDPLKSLRSD